MNNISKILATFTFISLIFLSTNLLAKPQYSRVFFFGDSLSDIGNNIDGLGDQAPITNFIKDGDTYKPGYTWVVPFAQHLKADGFLVSDHVVASRLADLNISINPSDNIDYAYTGDPSDGYSFNGHNYIIQFHKLDHENDGCVSDHTSPDTNDLCGAKNRIREFVNETVAKNGTLDSNALYVIWIGPNDILQDLGRQLEQDLENGKIIDPNTYQHEQAIKTILHINSSIGYAVSNLSRYGAKHFVIINLPNLAITADGYLLNLIYNGMHPDQPQDVIKTMFTDLTNNFNAQLKTNLDNMQQSLSVDIVQPDISKLFEIMRLGQLAAFPASSFTVNKDPAISWVMNCCDGENDTYPTYNPNSCHVDDQCMGGIPKLPNNEGHYVFFNGIHPTTCVHKYVAAFVESYLPGAAPFNPSVNLCTDD